MPALTQAIPSTPGIYYAIAYWLSCTLYIRMNNRRYSGLKLIFIQLLFLAAITSFMIFTDGVPLYLYFPCIFFIFFLILLFFRVCCDMNWKNTGYFALRAFILGEFAASLQWQFFYYLTTNWLPSLGRFFSLIFLCAIHIFVFAIMFVLERRYRSENAKIQIEPNELTAMAIICLITYGLSNMSYVYEGAPFSSSFPTEMFTIRTLVDFAGLGFSLAYNIQLFEYKTKTQVLHLENMLQLQYKNYQLSKQSIELVNQKYHDLKHQIEIIRLENAGSNKLSYLDQIEQDIKFYEAQNKTGNNTLDTILTAKSLQCHELGITLTCVADGQALSFMDPIAISALFGNALDNAIESVRKTPDPEKRLINLSIAPKKHFLRIRIKNYFEGQLHFENGLPATSKKDKQYHGFGLKSMQATVKKYHGSMTIETQNNWFELCILFPLHY